MTLESAGEGRRHAARKRAETGKNRPLEGFVRGDFDVFKYIFELQGAIEKEGRMDYHRYAKRMWKELTGEEPSSNDEGFVYFENTMIQRLHDIDMRMHVYPETKQSFRFWRRFVGSYGDRVKNIALWSNGDVESTGYQPAKINRSEVIEKFKRGARWAKGRPKAKKLMREKTSYLVDDNKMSRLVESVRAYREKHPNEKIKLVIIEDSLKTFDSVYAAIAEKFGKDAQDIEIVPIWATYSREGRQAEARAREEGKLDEFAELKKSLNAIDSLKDLLDEKRFGPIFDKAHVFVDFDGVIGNNITMRQDQAEVIFTSLVEGFCKGKNMTESWAREELIQNARKIVAKKERASA